MVLILPLDKTVKSLFCISGIFNLPHTQPITLTSTLSHLPSPPPPCAHPMVSSHFPPHPGCSPMDTGPVVYTWQRAVPTLAEWSRCSLTGLETSKITSSPVPSVTKALSTPAPSWRPTFTITQDQRNSPTQMFNDLTNPPFPKPEPPPTLM